MMIGSFFRAGCFIVILILTTNCSGDNPAESSDTLWQFQAHREEVAPAHWVDEEIRYEGSATLALAGDGQPYANGCWSLELDVIPGSFYKFQTHFMQKKVDEPNRTVLARIVWQGKDGNRVFQPEYPGTLRIQTPDGWHIIQQRYQAPEDAVIAKLELVFRWDADGTVYFSEATLEEVQGLVPRFVKLATVHHRPENSPSSLENLHQFAEHIKAAAERDADIVCLPEAITLVGTGKSYAEVSEPVPGPSTDFLGKVAREHNIYVVAGIMEREGPVIYNTAVLLDRNGIIGGKYRKVALPREEIEGGVTPGYSYPVFDPEGALMAEATAQEPVIVVEVDLNRHTYWPWLGDLKNRIPREIPGKKRKAY